MSIVVIEPDADLRSCVREILKEEGFLADAFVDADKALQYLEQNPAPTLILLDLQDDGAAFRERQMRNPRLARVPVIVISAHPDGARDARRLAAADFLEKPFSPEELLHVVQNRAVTLTRMEHFLRGALRS